jgi:hypothetical protein
MFQSNISPSSGFNSKTRNQQKQVARLSGFLLGLFFDPEDGGKMLGTWKAVLLILSIASTHIHLRSAVICGTYQKTQSLMYQIFFSHLSAHARIQHL